MPRIRSIKPEFPQSESMGRVSRDARLLFVLLWTICDDSGRTRAASRMLASLLFPYDDDAASLIEGWLGELEREGCIVRYSVDGSAYMEVCKWSKHQKIDKPSPSRLPSVREDSRALASPREDSSEDLGSRTVGSVPRTPAAAAAVVAPDPPAASDGARQEPAGERIKAPVRKVQSVAPPRVLAALRGGSLRHLIAAYGGNLNDDRMAEWERDLDGLSLHQVVILFHWRRSLGMPIREPSGARRARDDWRNMSPEQRKLITLDGCEAVGLEAPAAARA